MPESGAELGVDLYWLSTVANDDLLSVANYYVDASKNVSLAGGPVEGLMSRPAAFGGGTSPIFDFWHGVHTTVARFLSDTAENLQDTSRALNLAIGQYTATDHGAKVAFDAKRTELGTSAPDPVK